MKKINFILASLTLLFSVCLTSCNDYLDINDNPNYPKDASLNTLLPSVGASTIAQTGVNGQLLGDMWNQYVTQGNTTNQYNNLANYSLTQSSYTAFWTNAYANTLPDIKIILAKSEAENAWNYWLIATVLKAYAFHVLTDLYGDIPFTEATNAAEFPNPKYDDSKTVVYPGIIALLDAAIAKQADAKAASNPVITTGDYFFRGNIDKWVAFAKTLKLKLYLRDFNANSQAISSLIAAGGLLEEDCAFTVFEDATNKGNPLYEYNIRQLNTRENMRACHTFTEFLLANNDPRIQAYYNLSDSAQIKINAGQTLTFREMYGSLPCGARPSSDAKADDAVPLTNSSRYKQDFSDPVYLMNAAECSFLVAEAQARLGNAAAAKTAYETAVTKAFGRFGYSSQDFIKDGGVYAFDGSSTNSMIKCIMLQKWVSGAKANSWDSWMDRNRTGIPEISDAISVREKNAVPGLLAGYELGTLVRPGTTVLQPREFPRRLMVPNVSDNYNSNAPKAVGTQIPLWWQVEQGK